MYDEHIQEVLRLIEAAQVLVESDLTWEAKYDAVFGLRILDKLPPGVNIEWCDPDSTYEDDVLAYYRALQDFYEEWSDVAKRMEA